MAELRWNPLIKDWVMIASPSEQTSDAKGLVSVLSGFGKGS